LNVKISSLLIATLFVLGPLVTATTTQYAFAGVPPPATIQITGTIRDFHASHPDFEGVIGGLQTGQVSSTLGVDGKPVFVPPAKPGFTTLANFNEWYNDVAGVNLSGLCTLTLTKISDAPPTYRFEDTSFFPINTVAPECESGSLFGNEGNPFNYHFTLEIHTSFTYNAGTGQTLAVSNSDDDLWYFVNGKLVVDLGGVHGPTSAPAVNLDTLAVTLGLVDGGTYPLDIFFAERHTTQSNFRFTTFLLEQQCPAGTTGTPPDCVPISQVVGGELLPINNVALVIAGFSSVSVWMAPLLAGIAGAATIYIKKKRN